LYIKDLGIVKLKKETKDEEEQANLQMLQNKLLSSTIIFNNTTQN
jgi:hypothetical protein